jgi:hypothetical protein
MQVPSGRGRVPEFLLFFAALYPCWLKPLGLGQGLRFPAEMAVHVADDVGYELCEVLVQIYRAGLPSAATKWLERAAVELALWR